MFVQPVQPTQCFISRAIRGDFIQQEKHEHVLDDLKEVRINRNVILSEIMARQYDWLSHPTIFVDNAAYKLVTTEVSANHVVMFQVLVRITHKNGQQLFDVLNRRKVRINFK